MYSLSLSYEAITILADLTRLGYWVEAQDAEYSWAQHRDYVPPWDSTLPWAVMVKIHAINTAL